MTVFTFEKIGLFDANVLSSGQDQSEADARAKLRGRSEQASGRAGFWRRFFDAVCKSRMMTAQRAINRLHLDARYDL
jgi:hypothetical protein